MLLRTLACALVAFVLASGPVFGQEASIAGSFNHANYGAYNTVVNTATFGAPAQNLVNAYLPRVAQFAFRLGF